MKKIIFMGTPDFSAQVLKGLIAAGYEITAVVTQPDRPVGRKRVLTASPVKEVALEHNLTVYQPEKLSKSQELEILVNLDADLIVTAAYGQFVPTKLLEAPKFGAINTHASLLPKYRGGAPIQYAIKNGDAETGVTIMEMVKEMDAGDIITQASIPIEAADDNGTMFEKLAILGRDLLLETLPKYFAGEIEKQKQDLDLVTFSPTISSEDEHIDWNQTAEEVGNLVRALHPAPIAHTYLAGERWKIWQGHPSNQITDKKPGQVVGKTKKEILIACGQGTIYAVTKIQSPGKKAMMTPDFLNGSGHLLEEGMSFE